MLGQFVAGQPIKVEIYVSKEISHPNTVDHHIAKVLLFYVVDGSQLPIELGRAELGIHGGVEIAPVVKFSVVIDKPAS